MKKLLYTAFLFASVAAFGQKTAFILIDGIISSDQMIKTEVPKNSILSMNVYKTAANLPQNLKNWSTFSENGLVELKLKKDAVVYDRISLADLNEQVKLARTNPVYFDGRKIENTELKIFGNVLQNMEVKMIDGVQSLSISSSVLK